MSTSHRNCDSGHKSLATQLKLSGRRNRSPALEAMRGFRKVCSGPGSLSSGCHVVWLCHTSGGRAPSPKLPRLDQLRPPLFCWEIPGTVRQEEGEVGDSRKPSCGATCANTAVQGVLPGTGVDPGDSSQEVLCHLLEELWRRARAAGRRR